MVDAGCTSRRSICWRAIESPRDSYIRAMSNLERAKYKDSEGRIELVLVVPSETCSTTSGNTKRSKGDIYKCHTSVSRVLREARDRQVQIHKMEKSGFSDRVDRHGQDYKSRNLNIQPRQESFKKHPKAKEKSTLPPLEGDQVPTRSPHPSYEQLGEG